MAFSQLILIIFFVGGIALAMIVGIRLLLYVAAWISNPKRLRVTGAEIRGLAVGAGAWLAAVAAGFFGRDPAGNPILVVIWVLWAALILGGVVVVACTLPGVSGPVCAGALLAGAYVAAFGGDYAAHAVGWHGESLHRYGGEMGPSAPLGFAVLFSPVVFLVGCLVGTIARAVVIRRPHSSA